MSTLVTSEIFRLFVNRLIPDDKYPVEIGRFSYNNFKRLYLKKNACFAAFYCISEMCMKFTKFWKKSRVT